MDQAAAERIVLIAGPGPEVLAALLVLMVALMGALVGIMMARRGRVEAWSLVGVFGLVVLGAAMALAYVPTRLALDRNGIALSFWSLHDRRDWQEVSAAVFRRGPLGTWVAFAGPDGRPLRAALWARWPGLLVPDASVDGRQIALQIETWRLAGKR
jgi:hypothetical protein